MKIRLTLLVCASIVISSCASRHEPAPVVSLSTRLASQNNLTEISGDTYTVQPGDTLFAIAFYSGNTYRDLAKLNSLSEPYTINVGQTLRLTSRVQQQRSAQNIDVEQKKHASTNVSVDPALSQAYGESERKKRLNLQKTSNKPSTKPIDRRWIWPATGKHAIATVGSDGGNRGLDIKGSLGSKVAAAADGKVVYAGNALKGYGNLIIIKHDDEYLSAYAHNQSILVNEQAYVKQGQQIATMGQSGASEVMLHFEIRKKGKSRDPFIYLPDI
jgi:lipoprotein NlpD